MEATVKGTFGNFKIHGDWATNSKKLKVEFPELTDEDLKYTENQEHELLTRLESRTGKKRDELIVIINKMQESKTK